MPYATHSPAAQNAAFISLWELAHVASSQAQDLSARITELCYALNMRPPDSLDLRNIGFVLGDETQVVKSAWVEKWNVGLFVNCCGVHTPPFRYPPGIATTKVSISWENGRDGALTLACPDVVQAWSQGKNVVVHCKQSFHRGPLGFVALCRKIFGFEPRRCMDLLARKRTVYIGYQLCDNRH